jgi:hypothetical protein
MKASYGVFASAMALCAIVTDARADGAIEFFPLQGRQGDRGEPRVWKGNAGFDVTVLIGPQAAS